jgi:methylsterol monooxygenase
LLTDHHDFHHANFIGCYSSSLRWWDHFIGTDLSYKKYKAKIESASKKGGDTAAARSNVNGSWEVNKEE